MWIVAVTVWTMACQSGPRVLPTSSTAEQGTNTSRTITTAHFVIHWQPAETTDAEVKAVQDRAELAYSRYSQLLGAQRMPTKPIAVRLNGDAEGGRGSTVSTEAGELILVRFPGPGGGYEASLTHELTHQIRWALWTNTKFQTHAFLFIEEGFAEILATEAGLPSQGFPTYGFPVAVAAGTWLKSNQALPLQDLVRRHAALNFRCMPQAYTLRLSFMTYVREKYGLEPIVRLAYWPEPLRPEDIEQVLGASLDTLASHWKAWLERQYAATKDADEQSAAFRQSPIRFFPVCGPDVLTAGS